MSPNPQRVQLDYRRIDPKPDPLPLEGMLAMEMSRRRRRFWTMFGIVVLIVIVGWAIWMRQFGDQK